MEVSGTHQTHRKSWYKPRTRSPRTFAPLNSAVGWLVTLDSRLVERNERDVSMLDAVHSFPTDVKGLLGSRSVVARSIRKTTGFHIRTSVPIHKREQ